MYMTTEKFSQIKGITGVTALDSSADTLAIYGENITLICVSGNIWVNPNATAVANATAFKMTAGADATAFKMTAGDAIDFATRSDVGVSIISDATGATYQVIKWGSVLC